MINYDYKATKYVIKFIQQNNIKNSIIYFLGVRIGPYVFSKRSKIKKISAVIVDNVAGLEWKRTKWNILVQIYLYLSAYLMAKASDYLVCDSEAILTEYDKMISSERAKKIFIPYGTYTYLKNDISKNVETDNLFKKFKLIEKNYYLIINRFVPENSYELILSEFLYSNTNCDLVLVTNYQSEIKFYNKLLKKLSFDQDKRIKFIGTIYDSEILNYLRLNARGYINGHTLGGTNPGLLESMSLVDVNIVYDVIFSRQVAENSVLYFDKKNKKLKDVIEYCDQLSNSERNILGQNAKKRMINYYSWELITKMYKDFFDSTRGDNY